MRYGIYFKVKYEEASDEVKALIDEQIEEWKITNKKLTLLHSIPAYHALMEWFPLEKTIEGVLENVQLISSAMQSPNKTIACSRFEKF